jgi:hypothetical protein
MPKRVLLIVIDALNSRVTRPAMEQGRLPNMQRLIEVGLVNWQCTSIFPSITPAATSAICTGQYPAKHHVMGAHYYDRTEDRVRYFGDDFWVVLKRGFRNFFEDFLCVLNQKCLSSDTLFQQLEREGRTCACINFLIFQGNKSYRAKTPWLLRLVPGIPKEMHVEGPGTLFLGDFVSSTDIEGEQLKASGGIFNRFGFQDKTTGQYLLQMARRGLPDFTLAYFPDNDFDSHARGPRKAIETVEKVDAILGELFDARGGLEAFLEETAIVIIGDHSQSDIQPEEGDPGIDLNHVLSSYHVVPAGEDWKNGKELMICPNLRVAQIYVRAELQEQIREIADRILTDQRVDQVIFKREASDSRHPRFVVRTADRGELEFWSAEFDEDGADHTAHDDFDNTWHLKGSLAAVDARVSSDEPAHLEYDDYPNALERIAQSFDNRYTGDLWVTARVGYEITLPKTTAHAGGGSHGSLHVLDSMSPLIVSDKGVAPLVNRPVRIVDVARLCRTLLDSTRTETCKADAC